jgi:septal ring factor EnvC (AmiA/AmiB activator)
MTSGRRKMAAHTQPIRDKIADLDRQIDDLQRKIAEAVTSRRHLQDVLAVMSGAEPAQADRKPRAQNVKGVVLAALERAQYAGLTSAETLALAQEHAPQVQRDTVSSLLSRLKSAGVAVYDGLRYYDIRYAPKDDGSRPRPHLQEVA